MRLTHEQLKNIEAAAAQVKKSWLNITVRELKKELHSRGINTTNTLNNSVVGDTHGKEMLLQYRMYGAFVDMNVGKGRSLDKNRESAMISKLYNSMNGTRGGRRAKRYMWYSKRMGKEQYRLAEIMMKLYGDAGEEAIKQAIPIRIELTL
jgi:hypothetical protein